MFYTLMKSTTQLFKLPSALLFLLATSTYGNGEGAHNLIRDLRSRAKEAALVQKRYEVQERIALETPIGVRKMSSDEGEKFFPEYWQFDEDVRAPRQNAQIHETYNEISNVTKAFPPYLLHEEPFQLSPFLAWLSPRAALSKRFQCPSNTQNCSSINRPDSCCATDETCVIVQNTTLGDVGCCPNGEQCGGQVSECDTDAGYSSCPYSTNGGCCIPNYTCMGVGCITVGASTTTTTLPLATATAPQSSSSSSSSSSSVSSSSVQTPTVTTTTTISSSGTATPLPPGRPTEDSSSSSSSSSTSTSSSRTSSSQSAIVTTYTTTQSGGGEVCPTGFYGCSAYYGGGCCRVGRDCQSTSCPIPATETVVVSNGVTIVAGSGSTPPPPSSGASATTTITGTSTIPQGGNCGNGWYSCAVSEGGGCCPSGYACGTICTATISGEQPSTRQKISVGPRVEAATWLTWAILGTTSFFGMLIL